MSVALKTKKSSNPTSISKAPAPKTPPTHTSPSPSNPPSVSNVNVSGPQDGFKMISSQPNAFSKSPSGPPAKPAVKILGAELSYGNTNTKLGTVGTGKMEKARPGSTFDPNRKPSEPTMLGGKPVDLSTYKADPKTLQTFEKNFSTNQGKMKQTQVEHLVDNAHKNGAVPPTMHPAEAKAITNYTSEMQGARGTQDYRDMNASLYKHDPKALQERQAQDAEIKTTASGLNKMPAHQGEVYRSANMPPETQAKYQVGKTVTEEGFVSTSTNPKASHSNNNFSGNSKYTIQSETGRDISQLSTHKGEGEVLFTPGTNFDVVKTKEVVAPKKLYTHFATLKLPPGKDGKLEGETLQHVTMVQVPSQK